MRWQHTAKSMRDYRAAPADVQKAFNKQVRLLSANIRHPSLHAKKFYEATDLRQARVNRNWRFYFLIQGDIYTIVTIVPHPK